MLPSFQAPPGNTHLPPCPAGRTVKTLGSPRGKSAFPNRGLCPSFLTRCAGDGAESLFWRDVDHLILEDVSFLFPDFRIFNSRFYLHSAVHERSHKQLESVRSFLRLPAFVFFLCPARFSSMSLLVCSCLRQAGLRSPFV